MRKIAFIFYSKPSHIACFCSKTKNKEQDNEKNAKDNDNYLFIIRNEVHFKSMCKLIIDLGASKHMTLHKATFNTNKVIVPHNVYLGDNSFVEVIKMGSIIVETIVKGNINQIHIKYAFHVSKLYTNLLSVNKFVTNV